VVGMQVRQQHVHGVGIGIALQRAEHAGAEVKDKRWGVRRGEQVTRSWRIRPGHTAGATEYGDSHAH
jgi:hypothetical protein